MEWRAGIQDSIVLIGAYESIEGQTLPPSVLGKNQVICYVDALDASSDLYFDRVSQIHMGKRTELWSHGRVTLLGDAASCVSLLAGQGSALAMVAALRFAGFLAPRSKVALFIRNQVMNLLQVQWIANLAMYPGAFPPAFSETLSKKSFLAANVARRWLALCRESLRYI